MAKNEKLKTQAQRLQEARLARGFADAKAAAAYFGWNYTTYSQHERGQRGLRKDVAEKYARALRVSASWLMMAEGRPGRPDHVPVMGKIGAGAEISPEFEQVPPEGLYEVQTDIALPEGMIAFEVEGESMLPRYDPGDIVICARQGVPPEQLPAGAEAAVITDDGRRYLKRVRRSEGVYVLESHNALPISCAGLKWASEVASVVRARNWRKLNEAILSKHRKLRK